MSRPTVAGVIPISAVVSAASAGDNTLVAATSGSRILVLSAALVASGGANTIRFESGAGGTALTGQMDIADNGQFILDFSPAGHFETAKSALLNLELSAATSVAGVITYVVI